MLHYGIDVKLVERLKAADVGKTMNAIIDFPYPLRPQICLYLKSDSFCRKIGSHLKDTTWIPLAYGAVAKFNARGYVMNAEQRTNCCRPSINYHHHHHLSIFVAIGS